MSHRNRCERCNELLKGERARHKQTKYCAPCAKAKKKENTLSTWTAEEKRRYMRHYMCAYRRSRPGLSSPYVRKYRQKKQEKFAAAVVSERPDPLTRPLSVDYDALCLRSLAWFLPLLYTANLSAETVDSVFEIAKAVIAHLELFAIKATGLVIVLAVCWRHLTHFWGDKEK